MTRSDRHGPAVVGYFQVRHAGAGCKPCPELLTPTAKLVDTFTPLRQDFL